jgi:hypothetical protein
MNKHPYLTTKKSSVFTQPFFKNINVRKWNDEMGPFYKRINSLKDDRSFVILITTIIEFHTDRLLGIAIPGYEKNLLKDSAITFSIKLNLLKSLNLLPPQIFNLSDCVRKIRNEFAHNVEIDNISDIKLSGSNNVKLIMSLEGLCNEYSQYLTYSKHKQNDYREKFKDIASFVIHAFREYEPNFIFFRKEIDTVEFENTLSIKAKHKYRKFQDII